MKKNRKKGFTLFELLVSISIIAILTALATISFSNAQKKARDTKRIQDINAVKKALEMYYSDNNYSYPDDLDELVEVGSDETPYLQKNPTDPKGGDYGYTYTHSSDWSEFCYCAIMEDEDKGNADEDCDFGAVVDEIDCYCAKNQQ